MTTYRISLPFVGPPLTSNQRLHHMRRAALVGNIRLGVGWLTQFHRIPRQEHITVQLHYAPGDNRRRDPSNLMPTQKASLDGIVDAGVVPDDSPQYVTELMPAIHPPPAERGMWLEITTKETP